MNGYTVRGITRKECEPFIIGIHYAKRWPSVSFRFGLFLHDELVGIVTYGTPSSSPLRKGVAGEVMSLFVIELNRLCLLNNNKNEASFLVSKSLKLLEGDKIIVSFADKEQGHLGYVYQACNFSYHGLSAKRTDWEVKGLEHLHGQTLADEFRGKPNRSKLMKEKYGDDFYLKPRSRKHRYIYIIGSRKFKKSVELKYKQEKYPKKVSFL